MIVHPPRLVGVDGTALRFVIVVELDASVPAVTSTVTFIGAPPSWVPPYPDEYPEAQ
jgi:hypothetical protein